MADKSDKRKELEARAAAAGLDYPHNIGDAKLEERVEAAEAAKAQAGGGQDAGGTTPPASTAAKTSAPKEPELVVEVVGPRKGRRRAGRHFGPEPVIIPLDELTEDEKAALVADPVLTVVTREADT